MGDLATIIEKFRIEADSMRQPEGGVVAELAAELEEAAGHAGVCASFAMLARGGTLPDLGVAEAAFTDAAAHIQTGVDARIALAALYRAVEPWLDECWDACERAHTVDGPVRKRKPIDDRFLALVEAMEQAQVVLPKHRTGSAP